MKKILAGALAVAMATFAAAPAQAWRGGGFGGFHDGGGFVAHGPNGGWAAGGFHDGGAAGWGGTWHGDGYHAGAVTAIMARSPSTATMAAAAGVAARRRGRLLARPLAQRL